MKNLKKWLNLTAENLWEKEGNCRHKSITLNRNTIKCRSRKGFRKGSSKLCKAHPNA